MKSSSSGKTKIYPEAVTEDHIILEVEGEKKREIENPEEYDQKVTDFENPEEETDEKFPKTDVRGKYIWRAPISLPDDEDEKWRMKQYRAILKENDIKIQNKYKWKMDGGHGNYYGKLVDIRCERYGMCVLYFVDVWHKRGGKVRDFGILCNCWGKAKEDGEFIHFNGKRTNDTFKVFLHLTKPKSFRSTNLTYPPPDSDKLPHNRSNYLNRHNLQLHQKALNPDLTDEEIEKIRGGRKKTKRKKTKRKRTRRKGRKRTKRKRRRRKRGKKTRRIKKQIGCRKN